ncbi:MAG: serine O-acetyltransferase [Vibrionaceae bacterium]
MISDVAPLSCEQRVWKLINEEVTTETIKEPILANFFHTTIVKNSSLSKALSYILAQKLSPPSISMTMLREVIDEAYANDPTMVEAAAYDICAVVDRDPAVKLYSVPLLYLKGFHALQAFRVASWLWKQQRHSLAIYLQNQISAIFQVDIHPAATIGKGIMLDHATGIVIGETAVVEDNVSILQDVTLGGTGKHSGDRHPKIRASVLIGAGAKVLGNIEIGEGAKIAACSVVLHPVPANATAAGVPAKIVGRPSSNVPSLEMDHGLNEWDEQIAGNRIL